MAAIEIGYLYIEDQYQNSKLDFEFDIEGIDLTGKTLLCQAKSSTRSDVAIEFKETDGSLEKTVVSETLTTVRFYKGATEMDIIPGVYQHTIIMYTESDADDTEVIAKGKITIINQITTRP